MKRTMAMVIVLLGVTAAAQAVTAVYAEFTYPTMTTWKLYLTETTDWTGVRPTAGSGFGIAGWAVDIVNALPNSTATNQTPSDATINSWNAEANDGDGAWQLFATVGFRGSAGGTAVVNDGGVAQLNGGQNSSITETVFHGFGVAAGSYSLPAGRSDLQLVGSYSWAAPTFVGVSTPSSPLSTAKAGVLVYSGQRASGATVSLSSDQARCQANIWTADSGTEAGMVDVVMLAAAPEPTTMGLIVIGCVATLYRRRR
jgi:hypothetical protein